MIDITTFSEPNIECANTLVKIINETNNKKLEKNIYKLMNGFHDKLVSSLNIDKSHKEYYINLMFEDVKRKIYLYDYDSEYNIEIESYLLCTLTAIFRKHQDRYK